MDHLPDQYELLAEQYVAGTLPPNLQDEFEEHFLACKICREEVLLLQAVREGVEREPRKLPATAETSMARWGLFSWRTGLAFATMVLVAAAAWFWLPHPSSQTVAIKPENISAPAPENRQAQPNDMLAQLDLPPYVPVVLRGSASAEADFQLGMKAYQSHDCATAAEQLDRVARSSSRRVAAQFYRGACLLKLADAAGAASALAEANHDGSPYQQAARFYLALADRALGKDTDARKLLQQAAAQEGDYAERAQSELQKLPSQ